MEIWSTPTHRLAEEQDTRLRSGEEPAFVSMCCGGLQTPFRYTVTSPLTPPPAAQKPAVGQEMAFHCSLGGSAEPAVLQRSGAPGVVEASAEDAELPRELTALTMK